MRDKTIMVGTFVQASLDVLKNLAGQAKVNKRERGHAFHKISHDNFEFLLDLQSDDSDESPYTGITDEKQVYQCIKNFEQMLPVLLNEHQMRLYQEIVSKEVDNETIRLKHPEYFNKYGEIIVGRAPADEFERFDHNRSTAFLYINELNKDLGEYESVILNQLINLKLLSVHLVDGKTIRQAYDAITPHPDIGWLCSQVPSLEILMDSPEAKQQLTINGTLDGIESPAVVAILNEALRRMDVDAHIEHQGDEFGVQEGAAHIHEGYALVHYKDTIHLLATKDAPELDFSVFKKQVAQIGEELEASRWIIRKSAKGIAYQHIMPSVCVEEPLSEDEAEIDRVNKEFEEKIAKTLMLQQIFSSLACEGYSPVAQVVKIGFIKDGRFMEYGEYQSLPESQRSRDDHTAIKVVGADAIKTLLIDGLGARNIHLPNKNRVVHP